MIWILKGEKKCPHEKLKKKIPSQSINLKKQNLDDFDVKL